MLKSNTWTPTNEVEFRADYLSGLYNDQLALKYAVDKSKLLYYICAQLELGKLPERKDFTIKPTGITEYADLDQKVTRLLKANANGLSIEDIANRTDASPKMIEETIERLQLGGFLAAVDNGYAGIVSPQADELSDYAIERSCSTIQRIGVIADTHLCSKYCDEELLNDIYDVFADMGVTNVFHCGNWVDGDAKFNFADVHTHGMQPQIEYFVNNYPSRTGMTTHILDGDDHEGWWHQKLNMKPGLVLEALARQAGRNDLNYLGYMTRDVLIPSSNGCTRIRVNHPGGGSTQNISGKLQNVINSLGRGVHPDIFLMGHYHKKMYLEWRGVHGFFVPCTCDDTPFMQKKLIHNVKGALVVSFTQAPDGSVLELDPKFLPGGNLRQWEHL